MFYVKSKLGNGITINTEILPGGIRKSCDICEAEMPVVFSELVKQKIQVIFTSAYCDACREISNHVHATGGTISTLDEIIWARNILRDSGFVEELDELFHEFGIHNLTDLSQCRYERFGKALSKLMSVKGSGFDGQT